MNSETPSQHRVLIADDHPVVLGGIRSMLSEDTCLEIIGEASTGKEAIRLTETQRPDVLVLDITMPEGHGLDALATLGHRTPETKIVIYTVHESAQYVHDCLVGGARGYVLKSDRHADLRNAVLSVLAGKLYLSPSICQTVVDRYLAADSRSPETLTQRQREIIRLFAQGLRAKEIARQLDLSPKTVDNQRYRLMRKLHLRSPSALIGYALETGLIEPTEIEGTES